MSFHFSSPSANVTQSLNYFSDLGQDYDRYRPGYPTSAIDTILMGLESPSSILAVDVGAGTGIGSRLLADRGIHTVAVEPNEHMQAAAKPHERVEYLVGTAEKIPLQSLSVDLVTSFQAFHWFDFPQSLREFHRILKPNGYLALVWNFWDQRDPVSRTYMKLIYQVAPPADRYLKPPERLSLKSGLKTLRYQLFWHGIYLPYFKNLRRYYFTTKQLLDLEGLNGLARSQGFTPETGEGIERLKTNLKELYNRHSNPLGFVPLLYKTHLYVACRN